MNEYIACRHLDSNSCFGHMFEPVLLLSWPFLRNVHKWWYRMRMQSVKSFVLCNAGFIFYTWIVFGAGSSCRMPRNLRRGSPPTAALASARAAGSASKTAPAASKIWQNNFVETPHVLNIWRCCDCRSRTLRTLRNDSVHSSKSAGKMRVSGLPWIVRRGQNRSQNQTGWRRGCDDFWALLYLLYYAINMLWATILSLLLYFAIWCCCFAKRYLAVLYLTVLNFTILCYISQSFWWLYGIIL